MVLAVVGTNALYFMLIVVAESAANHAFRNQPKNIPDKFHKTVVGLHIACTYGMLIVKILSDRRFMDDGMR